MAVVRSSSAKRVFLDTSVIVSGLIDQGDVSRAPQAIFDAIAAGDLPDPHTAWHCCLETFAVLTRLPRGLQVEPETTVRLIVEEILGRFRVHQMPAGETEGFLGAVAADALHGGRIYDAHIAEVARHAGCDLVVTDNRRHFSSLLRFGIPVLTAVELVETEL